MSSKSINTTNNPTVSLIIHGGGVLGYELSKSLLDQGGKVIIVDKYNTGTKKSILELKKLGSADLIDIKQYSELLKNLNRIDYIFYLLRENTTSVKQLNSSDFLEESNNLNTTLKALNRFNSKGALITSLNLNKEYGAKIINRNNTIQPYTTDELQKYCEAIVAEHRDKGKLNVRIIRLGEILNINPGKTENSIVDKMLNDIKSKSQIIIEGEGLDKHYLIDIKDTVYGILKLTFDDETAGEVITLANPNEYSTLTLAYKLLELIPEVKDIVFSKKANDNNSIFEAYIPSNNGSNYGWTQSVTIETSLKQESEGYGLSLSSAPLKAAPEKLVVESINTPLGQIVEKAVKPVRFDFKEKYMSIKTNLKNTSVFSYVKYSIITILSIYLFYVLIYPIILIVYGLGFTYFELKDLDLNMLQESSRVQEKINNTSNHLSSVTEGLESLKWVFNITNQNELYIQSSQTLFAFNYGLSGSKTILAGIEPLQDYITVFQPALSINDTVPTTSTEYRAQLLELKANRQLIDKGAYDLVIASSILDSVEIATFPGFIQKYIIKVKELNDQLSKQITPIKQTAILMPDILGIEERMTYLVVLQNSSELRSTGGWISSYVKISLENGQIRELKVDDVYNIDGQLQVNKVSIPAPTSMRKAIGISDMKLSLVNWYPDTKSLQYNSEYIFKQLEPGTEIDGVITLDTEVIKSLLRIYGEVTIPGNTEAITADNFDKKLLELHSEFVPGESLKSTFLANLINSLSQKIIDDQGKNIVKQVNEVTDLLNHKSIQIYVNNENINNFLSEMKWSGELRKEYLSSPIIVEWNWGANKVNSNIERSAMVDIDIVSESEVVYNYNVCDINISCSSEYALGDFRIYHRIFLPLNAKIISLSGFEDNRYDEYLENGYRVVGGWFNIPIKSSKNFQLRYRVKQNTASEYSPVSQDIDEIKLLLNHYKQPGILELPLDIKITYPDTWATIEQGEFERYLNQLTLSTKTQSDIYQQLIWKKK